MDQLISTPSPELPKPERLPEQPNQGEIAVPRPEIADRPAQNELLAQASDAVAQAADDTLLATVSATVNQNQPAAINPALANNPVASDVEVSEKEWIEKAKEIVDNTKTDPRAQSTRITGLKHDYIKERYGKEIILPEKQETSS
jgi:hypothetical protein